MRVSCVTAFSRISQAFPRAPKHCGCRRSNGGCQLHFERFACQFWRISLRVSFSYVAPAPRGCALAYLEYELPCAVLSKCANDAIDFVNEDVQSLIGPGL